MEQVTQKVIILIGQDMFRCLEQHLKCIYMDAIFMSPCLIGNGIASQKERQG